MAVEKLVVGLTGMLGAGKSVVVNVVRAGGYGVVVMGDEVREEVELGKAIAITITIAEHIIVNEESLETAKKQAAIILKRMRRNE